MEGPLERSPPWSPACLRGSCSGLFSTAGVANSFSKGPGRKRVIAHAVATGSVAASHLCHCGVDAAGAGARTDGVAAPRSHCTWKNKPRADATPELANFFLESKSIIQRGDRSGQRAPRGPKSTVIRTRCLPEPGASPSAHIWRHSRPRHRADTDVASCAVSRLLLFPRPCDPLRLSP